MSTTDRIVKQVTLRASRTRVWRAISDHREFGAWFGAALETPFVVDQPVRGRITYPGYEHLMFEAHVERMEPERYFAMRWHPASIDPKVDYSKEPTTLVEFQLEDTAGGTLLTITESGFDKLPASRRADAFRLNDSGWSEQTESITKYVAQHP
jgi:uncharacterized protein YndB with AHSA1/START domain